MSASPQIWPSLPSGFMQGPSGPVSPFGQAFYDMPKFTQTVTPQMQAFLLKLRVDLRPESVSSWTGVAPSVPPDAPEWWTFMPQAIETFTELPAYAKKLSTADQFAWRRIMPKWIPPDTEVLPPEILAYWEKHRPKVSAPAPKPSAPAPKPVEPKPAVPPFVKPTPSFVDYVAPTPAPAPKLTTMAVGEESGGIKPPEPPKPKIDPARIRKWYQKLPWWVWLLILPLPVVAVWWMVKKK